MGWINPSQALRLTCLNRLISIEYKNKWNVWIISDLSYISDMHILANSQNSTFPVNASFFPQNF